MVGNDIACDILIRHFRRLGLSIEAINDEGFTALLMAAKHGHITCAQILVGQGKSGTQHRDSKYGLSVEEWLAKKGFTLQDIKPIRQDGKGRSRFVKLANIAAICSGPRKHSQSNPSYGEIDYDLNNFQMNEGDNADATTEAEFSNESISRYIARYSERFNDIDVEYAQKHYKVYPYRQNNRPKQKTASTQTQSEEGDAKDEDVSDHDSEEFEEFDESATMIVETTTGEAVIDFTVLQHDPRIHLEKREVKRNKMKNQLYADGTTMSVEKARGMSNKERGKRFSLPEIQHTPSVYRNEVGNKVSELETYPENLIASIDLGDGRRLGNQQQTGGKQNNVYWSTVGDDRHGETDEERMSMPKFERTVSDNETSTTEDGPMF